MVTAPGSGAEIIPFLKTWVNLPMAIAFTIAQIKVHERAAVSQPFPMQHLAEPAVGHRNWRCMCCTPGGGFQPCGVPCGPSVGGFRTCSGPAVST